MSLDKTLENQSKDATKESIIFQLTQAMAMIDTANKVILLKTTVFLMTEKV